MAHELVHVGQQNKGATIKIARSRNLVMRVETKGKSKWDLLAEELNNLSEEKQIERLEKLSENEIATFLKSKLEFQVVGERSRKFKLYIYHKHLKDKNWNEAVLSLNGLNDSDITKLISEATNQQLVELFKSTERILARGPRQSFILKSIQEYILSKTSKLSQRDRTSSESVEYIVLHQTGSSTVESTLNTYDKRIKNKEHVGAHYLVGKEGETFSTISDEKVVFHVRGNKDASIVNANSIGIEHVGMPHAITPPILKPKDKGFEMSDVRTQIKALNLSPKLKARILSNTDTALYTLLKANGWNIYEDITGAQKRATLRLIVHLMRKYNLRDAKGNMDLSKIKAHEEADKKTIGEGENITEFIQTMKEMIELVKQLNMGIVAREKAGEDVSEYKKIYESNGINLIHKWVDTIRMDDSSGEVDTVPDNFFNSFYSEVEKTRNAVAEISK